MSQPTIVDRPAVLPVPPSTRFCTIVVGVADDDGARDAAALALDLAAEGATLVLTALAVDPMARPLTGAEPDPARMAHAAQHVDRVAAVVASEAPACTIARDVRTVASVGGGLRAAARDHDADLLVVASSRRGALLRVLGVNDVRAALDRSPCALAVAPRGYADGPRRLTHVGVGWDRSHAADAAIAAARGISQRHEARLEVLQVLAEVPWAADPTDAGRRDPHRTLLARERLAAEGLDATGVAVAVREGNATAELAAFGEHLDLLVLGVPLEEGHLCAGRTAHGLLRHLGCALLVVPGRT